MQHPSIKGLLEALEQSYPGGWRLYGTPSVPDDNMGFELDGVPATFSVSTLGGELPARRYDVQVEGVPPGDYVHTDELDLGELLALIERFRSGEEHWP